MKLDREYQKEILRRLADSYPDYLDCMDWLRKIMGEDWDKYAANMLYLEGHGLVESGIKVFSLKPPILSSFPKITAKGIDFITDDGGLSAILGVVTIKFHEDTIRMIEDKIMSSSMNPPDKQKFVDALKQLPAETIKHLTMRLLDLGLDNWQAAFPAIQKYVQDLLN